MVTCAVGLPVQYLFGLTARLEEKEWRHADGMDRMDMHDLPQARSQTPAHAHHDNLPRIARGTINRAQADVLCSSRAAGLHPPVARRLAAQVAPRAALPSQGQHDPAARDRHP